MDLGSILLIGVIVVLWIAAAAFGADSRDGLDWLSRASPRDRPFRSGD